jgi:hypothetical protein
MESTPTALNDERSEALGSAERTLSEALAVVLDVDHVPHEGHFFDDLGADSLVVAEFCARLRNAPDLPRVSIKDVYQHPTIASLAQHLDLTNEEECAAPVESLGVGHADSDQPATSFEYWLCGFLQLATLVGLAAVAGVIIEVSYDLIASASGVRATYVRSVAVGSALFVLLTTVPIALKWLVIGRWRPNRIRLWSLGYFRFWLGRIAAQSNPMVLFAGTPMYPL